jgi:Icc-related predicted phosphoesterase
MRILAFSDLHENMKALARLKVAAKKADVIICAGDFTVFGRSTEKMLREIDALGAPVVLIHGNHEDEDEVVSHLPKFKNIHWAHGKVIELVGFTFFGFGGHGFHRREPELEQFEQQLGDKIGSHTIILCHAPPYGTTLDEVDEGWHVGNESLTKLIRRRKPLLAFCGHIHECFHKHDSIAGTTVINPGPDGEFIEVED